MDLNKNDSNDSLNKIDSPLETPKVKPDSPLSYRVKEKIDEVFEEEKVINDNDENKELINSEKINKTRCKSMKEIINCDTKHKLTNIKKIVSASDSKSESSSSYSVRVIVKSTVISTSSRCCEFTITSITSTEPSVRSSSV